MRLSALTSLAGGPRRRILITVSLLLIGDLLWTVGRFPSHAKGRILTPADLRVHDMPALILGAGVLPDREPTQVLQRRLQSALDLFHSGHVRWFLVSGDNRSPYYNEPQAMRKWLLRQGVPPNRIVEDFAGRRTYDSLRRAYVVFGLRRVIIVTSDFHLPRAIFIAQSLGLEAWGVAAPTEHMPWMSQVSFWSREYIARHKALLDVWFPPDTLLGPREPTPEDWLSPNPESTP
ncbi:MAG: ElyC/SanA/YdcF family protein [Holophaga sp.]|nr:ElyC/SanA/YdcF family protein [Holophaga sp.]